MINMTLGAAQNSIEGMGIIEDERGIADIVEMRRRLIAMSEDSRTSAQQQKRTNGFHHVRPI